MVSSLSMVDREQAELSAVQNKVVDVTHLASLLFASLAMIPGYFRSRALCDYRATIVAVSFVILSFTLYLFRDRIPVVVRAIFLVGALIIFGGYVLFEAGIVAAAGFFLPTSVMLAWLLWKPRHAIATSVLAVVFFLAAAIKNVRHGGVFEAQMSNFNRMPQTWWNMFGIYTMTGVVILLTTRVLLGSVRSILARVRISEAEAKSERERLAVILRGVNDAIFLHDPATGRIVDAFGRLREILGYDASELIGEQVGMISAGISPWTTEAAENHMRTAMEQGTQTFLWCSKRKEGPLLWTRVTLQKISLDGQDLLLATIRDVDALMKTQLEFADLNADLERRVLQRTAEIERSREAMETFSYTVSHDLRAPLRAIDGFARVLQEDHGERLPQDAKVALERIVAGAGRMSRLIDALLSLSRLDRRKLESSPVDVSRIVREIRDELSADANGPSRGIEWKVGDLPAIRSDADLVRQVFDNLLGNACKFTRDVPEPRISIRATEGEDGIWFEVADNGIGFDMAYADRLFRVFQRLHDENIDGLGIGLATVKKIVERLDGAIEAEGIPGQGATFRFRLEPAKTESVQAG